MRYRKNRRYRPHSNGRSYQSRINGSEQGIMRSPSSLNGRIRNNIRSQQSAEKLAEKYNTLAKEAISTGDKTLSENYYQHADHFMRIVDEKNLNQNKFGVQVKDEPIVSNSSPNKDNKINQDKDNKINQDKDNKINQDKDIGEKKE